MPIEIVADGTGYPRYLVFDPDMPEPWVADVHDILRECRALDVARIFLITPDAQIEEVKFNSIDGEPDYTSWEVILVEGGEMVEAIDYDPAHPDELDKADRVIQVNGFGSRPH